MMTLLIDIGNSRCKWALTKENSGTDWLVTGEWLNGEFVQEHWLQQLTSIKQMAKQQHNGTVAAIVISCVADEAVREQLQLYCQQVFSVTAHLAESTSEYQAAQGLRLKNSYKVAEALGVDRWLAMIAGVEHVAGTFAILDAGTAITLDVVDATGQHLGGHIIPGQKLMRTSLLGDTGRIAWSAQHNQSELTQSDWLANSTQLAIEQGALHASVAYLQYCIEKLQSHCQLKKLIITGGDGEQLYHLIRSNLKSSVIYQKDLVLQGLFYFYQDIMSKKSSEKGN